MPVERLPKLDYCEKTDLFVPGGLGPVKNLADVWGEQGLKYHISNWRLTEAENFRIAADLFRRGAVDRAFVYSAAFDALQHDNVGRDDAKFGDAIFLADAGVQFVPSDMGVKPLNGMHGFDPADRDSAAAWLSTAPVPASVSRVCDYFAVMVDTTAVPLVAGR